MSRYVLIVLIEASSVLGSTGRHVARSPSWRRVAYGASGRLRTAPELPIQESHQVSSGAHQVCSPGYCCVTHSVPRLSWAYCRRPSNNSLFTNTADHGVSNAWYVYRVRVTYQPCLARL